MRGALECETLPTLLRVALAVAVVVSVVGARFGVVVTAIADVIVA